MTIIRIDERLPEDALASEAVLHVRRHLRARIRARAETAPEDLAHLFGFTRKEGVAPEWIEAASALDPLQAGARIASARRGDGSQVVTFGHDARHVEECLRWLAERKSADRAFDAIKATDLATLLELSKARDFACAQGQDAQGQKRYLPILIQGATGTGKELLAEGIHVVWARHSGAARPPFEVVQVAGMSADMISDELFGHARGAFTGAATERTGRLEAAHGGTLLIDEVGDLPREAQVRLLRFLQTQTMSRLGENREHQLSVRIIAATWHDLDADVREGKFREDLLHRLRVGSGLRLVPLTERQGVFDDVLPDLLADRGHRARPPIARSARDALAGHAWPGNLRELVGVLDESVALAQGDTIRLEHLPPHLQQGYLALPLHGRALGFLLDEVDGHGLPEEHVVWRIEQITAAVESIPLPPENEHMANVGHFLSLIDDSSEDHRRAVAEVKGLLALDRTRRHAEILSDFWKRVAAMRPPQVVVGLVRQAARNADLERERIEREIEAVKQVGAIGSDPWLRLLNEIHGLPLLRDVSAGELAKAFIALFSILKLVAPSIIEQVRADAKAGGFAKVRERVAMLMKEASAPPEDVIDTPADAPPAGRLVRDDWRRIAQYPTQRAAVEATGYDPRTITKYLAQHRIRNPWVRHGMGRT